ncbi:MAG: glycogen synthase GlgA [Candidatus Makaraimicrobium thalassicum]|nr:MAG: glycogen synthase GlgA [Candidatus Omnitrophota bacterium]
MAKKLSVAFLWHMHQPLYKDIITGKYHLPWVRLHSTYSYLDMASLLDDFPAVKVTFNLTPSLIWQLLDISGDKTASDVYLQLSGKNAADLTDKDRCFLLRNFFPSNPGKSILHLKRYKKLFSKRGDNLREDELLRKFREFSTADFRDLQVLFNLAWCGFTLKKKDALVRALVRKGSGYTEDDKMLLLKRQMEAAASIIPLYRRLQDEGRIEISTSPFYHPVLPLLCRGWSGKGFDFAEDARAQVRKAVGLYEEVFGRKPAGMWPPEGGVSREIIPVLADEGIKWAASDEGILLESFRGEDIPVEDLIYGAFTAEEGGRKIDMVFRDMKISDAVSFRYAHMPAKKAAADFVNRIKAIAGRVKNPGKGEDIAAVILDGENPWPYYADGGREFLSEIYKQLTLRGDTGSATIGGYLRSHSERKRISRLFSGSWIDRNFDKWTGSNRKKKAWEYLEKARTELFSSGRPGKEALEELYIAEGSDWFWWYDDLAGGSDPVFDRLFRTHLANIYTFMGKDIPHYLSEPVPARPSDQTLPGKAAPSETAPLPKVLIVSSEAVPFAKTGGLADVTASLAGALTSLGCDVRVIMPLYKCVTEGRFELTSEAGRIKHPPPGGMSGFALYANRTGKRTTYFLRNKKYFARDGLYGTPKGDYPDNGLRFGLFSRAVLDAVRAADFKPDVIHCNDWQSALIPFYLKFELSSDGFYRGIKTLFTIHNMAYQGVFSRKIMRRLGIPEVFFNMNDLEFYGKLSFMKSGILYSDAVSTVSRRYAREIMTPGYGCGLDGLLRTRRGAVHGIPNGVDYSIWSPENDRFIRTNFDAGSIEKKNECKKDLLEYTRLPLSPGAPLLGCVSRLTGQKGMDLAAGVMDRVVKLGAGVVILGRGSEHYNRMFSELAGKHPRSVYVCSDFNDELAHKIEAGCDMFIMASRYEPCGLNQMYSIKYGTIPIVRATGGLDDVIVDFDEDREKGNGFKFGPATRDALYHTVERAVRLYGNKALWKKLMARAMAYDFSWKHSAEQYLRLYRKI